MKPLDEIEDHYLKIAVCSLSQISWKLSPVPSHKVNAYLDRQHFGKVYWKVHHGIDWPVYYIKRNHRIYVHDVLSVYLIAKKYYPGDSNAIRSGLLHLEIDDACTRNPADRTQLESLMVSPAPITFD